MDSARESFSTPSRVNTRTSITVPSMPGGTRRLVSLTSLAFSPKIARSNFSSGVSCVSPFGADERDARFVQLRECGVTDVRDVRGDFLGPELRVASDAGQLFDVDRREAAFLTHSSRYQDGIFEVVAVPGHERDQQVRAERELAQMRRRAVGQH